MSAGGVGGFDPGGAGGSGGSKRNSSGTITRDRGAPYDHLWKTGPKSGLAKKLVIIFPLPKNSPIPPGATRDSIPLDANGLTQSAVFEMYINPDQLQVKHPTRSQVIQTIGGAYIDSFGYGLPIGSFSGSFGWGQDMKGNTGLDRMGTLKALYHGWQELTTTYATPCHLMLAGNATTDGINMMVHLGDLEIVRSKGSPLTINYSLTFTTIIDFNGPTNPKFIPPLGIAPLDGGTPGAEIKAG